MEHHKAHRLVNAWEFAKLARQAAELGRVVIAAGDFNSVPPTLPMRIIRDHAQLDDAWVITHPDTPDPSPTNPPSPQDAIRVHGVTADSPLNSYSAGKRLEPMARAFQGKRLDYVFYRHPPRAPSGALRLRPVDTRVVLSERVPARPFSFSDHFGLEATFEISVPPPEDLDETPSAGGANGQLSPSKDVSPDSITQALTSLTARYRFAQSQARFQLAVLYACLFLLLVIVVTAAWFPLGIRPVFILISIALTWLATTMLYAGFIYGNWEVNALTNIIEELELYRSSLEHRLRGGRRSQ